MTVINCQRDIRRNGGLGVSRDATCEEGLPMETLATDPNCQLFQSNFQRSVVG
jgi:hypothetical protein